MTFCAIIKKKKDINFNSNQTNKQKNMTKEKRGEAKIKKHTQNVCFKRNLNATFLTIVQSTR